MVHFSFKNKVPRSECVKQKIPTLKKYKLFKPYIGYIYFMLYVIYKLLSKKTKSNDFFFGLWYVLFLLLKV